MWKLFQMGAQVVEALGGSYEALETDYSTADCRQIEDGWRRLLRCCSGVSENGQGQL